jgi:hypothetical protein
VSEGSYQQNNKPLSPPPPPKKKNIKIRKNLARMLLSQLILPLKKADVLKQEKQILLMCYAVEGRDRGMC